MHISRIARSVLGLILPLCSLPIFAQVPEARLGKTITESSRVVLLESRIPQIRNAQDLGPVSPDMTVPGITLVFRRSAAQEAALIELLAAQQNHASPLYLTGLGRIPSPPVSVLPILTSQRPRVVWHPTLSYRDCGPQSRSNHVLRKCRAGAISLWCRTASLQGRTANCTLPRSLI